MMTPYEIKKYGPPYFLDRSLLRKFESVPNSFYIVPMYFFYYQEARKQKSNWVNITMKETQKRAGISRDNLTKARKQLVKFGVIRVVGPNHKKEPMASANVQFMLDYNRTE